MPSSLDLVFLSRPGPRTPKEHRASNSEVGFSYLANLASEALEEELSNLAYYTRQAFVILSLGGVSRFDSLLSNQYHK